MISNPGDSPGHFAFLPLIAFVAVMGGLAVAVYLSPAFSLRDLLPDRGALFAVLVGIAAAAVTMLALWLAYRAFFFLSGRGGGPR